MKGSLDADILSALIRPLLSWEILLLLGAILFASALTFTILVRRWTSQRHRVAMTEWGRQRGFQLEMSANVGTFGPPLNVLKQYSPQPAICLDDGRTRIVAVLADPPASVGPRQGEDASQPQAEVLEHESDRSRRGTGQVTWRLLLRRIEPTLRTAGLRPTHDRHSFLDLFSLSSFTGGGSDRFVLFASDSEAAREFPTHVLASLTPADVGVLVQDDALVLDFSSRPFDDLEFDRMSALADQLAKKLMKPG
jgi:hypothetical protein